MIFTGHQSVYCGYEIGIYSVVKPNNDTPLDKKPVVCLHDVDQSKIPGVIDGYNTTLVSQIAPYDPDDPIPSGEEVNLWFESPVGKLLRSLCASKNLYTANDNPSEYTVDIAKAAKKICYSFTAARQEDEESETPVQAGLEITVYPPTDGELKRIPESSVLVGSSRAFDILGLNLPLSLAGGQAPQITWGQLRQALSQTGTCEHSLDGQTGNQRRFGGGTEGVRAGRCHIQGKPGRPYLPRDSHSTQALQERQAKILRPPRGDVRSQVYRRPPYLSAADRTYFSFALAIHLLRKMA